MSQKAKNKQVGIINQNIIDVLELTEVNDNTPIFISQGNLKHIQNKHTEAYNKYKDFISAIIDSPDYVGKNDKNKSIEYVKEITIDNNEFVKVAVRISNKGVYFVRSLYVLNDNRVKNFIEKNTLHPLTNKEK